MDSPSQMQQHSPYPPQTASLGGIPTVDLDVPITEAFLFLFILLAIVHMTTFQLNRRKHHKFLISGVMFGFCMSRLVTTVLRIVWSTRPTNIRLAIAANIFVAAGVVLLLIANLIFAQRILRALHPHIGWHPILSIVFRALYVLIAVNLIMLITCTVQSFYTLSRNTHRIDRDIILYGQTYMAFFSFLPILIVLVSLILPRKTKPDNFGHGSFAAKIFTVLTAATLLCLGASFRVGTGFLPPRPRNNPAWYHSKACFYGFNFATEILVVALYAVVRVDQRFHIPDGAKGPGSYSSSKQVQADVEQPDVSTVYSREGPLDIHDETEEDEDKEDHDEMEDEDKEDEQKESAVEFALHRMREAGFFSGNLVEQRIRVTSHQRNVTV